MQSLTRPSDHPTDVSRRRLPRYAPGRHRHHSWTAEAGRSTVWDLTGSSPGPVRHRTAPGGPRAHRATALAAVFMVPIGASAAAVGLPGLDNPLTGQAEQTLGQAQASLGTRDAAASPVEANLAGPTETTVVADPSAISAATRGFTAVLADIPSDYLALYHAATTTCPGLDWSVLAAIGKIESNHGRSTLPGVLTGANPHGAKGPMQFLQSTFDAVTARHPVPAGGATPPSPHNPHDAIHTAAAYLCDNGARDDRDLPGAIYAYNRDSAYVNLVLANALDYRRAALATSEAPKPVETPKPAQTPKPSATPKAPEKPKPTEARKTTQTSKSPQPTADQPRSAARTAVEFARAQLGKPYVWGGNGDPGYDCSGLTTAAYAAAKIKLPRTAQTQYNHGPRLLAGTQLQPGDLLFFGTARNIHHVGISLGGTRMIHSPTFGQTVRIIEDFHVLGDYAGASRPAASSSAV